MYFNSSRTPKKRIDSAKTTLHNQQFSAEGGGWVGVWRPPGGLGIGVGKKYSAYPSGFHVYFDTDNFTARESMDLVLEGRDGGDPLSVGK